MIKSVFIFGIDGNMGQRYKMILERHLGLDVSGCDIKNPALTRHLREFDGFLVATPTHTHIEIIRQIRSYSKPILCEKPLTTDLRQLDSLEFDFKTISQQLRMINQYAYLYDPESRGASSYHYFKSGRDGLYWDCCNIVGLSVEKPEISNDSAVWRCEINGKKLSLSDMDQAYIDNLKDWVENPVSNYEYARVAHEKVARWFFP